MHFSFQRLSAGAGMGVEVGGGGRVGWEERGVGRGLGGGGVGEEEVGFQGRAEGPYPSGCPS